jgi:G3E family GTPase
MAVPVHIVSGFLGAGKTTAIRAQLEARRGERIAIIVNDFGEAALDEATLGEAGPFRIANIAGACVCCTAPEGFVDALGAVLEGGPDRLLIEPTGLARPQDLVDTIRRGPHRERLALRPVVVLVDPGRLARADAEESRLLDEQLQAADVVVANHTDRCSPDDLARFEARTRELWPEPLAVHRTRHGRIPPELMEWPEGAGEPDARRGGSHRHEPSTQGFAARSWRFAPERVFARERLLGALERLAAGDAGAPLVRFKGIFRTREGVLRLEWAGDAVHEAPSAHRRDSRADAIFRGGSPGALDAAGEGLAAALLGEEELRARAHEIELVLPGGGVRVLDRAALRALPGGVPDVSQRIPKREGEAARIDRLLAELGVPRRGEAVVCAADGFASQPVPVDVLAHGLLVHTLHGEPLPPGAGGPYRLLIPPEIAGAPPGCANVKAVTRIVLRPAPG